MTLESSLLLIDHNPKKDLIPQTPTYIVVKILRANAFKPVMDEIPVFQVKIDTDNPDLALVSPRIGSLPKFTLPDRNPQGHKIVHTVEIGTKDQNNIVFRIVDPAIRRIVTNVPTALTGTNVLQIKIVPIVKTETRLGAETTEIKNGTVTARTAKTNIPITTKEEVVNPAMTEIGIRTWKDDAISSLSMIGIKEIWTEKGNKIDNETFVIDQIQIDLLIDLSHLTQLN
jgi:hypothetical protein